MGGAGCGRARARSDRARSSGATAGRIGPRPRRSAGHRNRSVAHARLHPSGLNGGVAVTSIQRIGRVSLFFGFVAAISTASFGQSQDSIRARSLAYGSPFGAPVLNAPFSADATIMFTRTLDDGTVVERRAKARYYRDSAGHVRAEWVDIGLGGQNQTAGRYTSIWIMPGDGWVYAMDPSDQTFRTLPGFLASHMFHGGQRVMMPVGNDTYEQILGSQQWGATDDVDLGQRQIEGVNTIGRRVTKANLDNEERALVEERWESPELKVVLYSRLSDSRAGASVDYRLTNIIRAEPPPQLFATPPEMILHGAFDRTLPDSHGDRRFIISVRPCRVGCTPR